MNERFGRWLKKNTPDREQLAQSRWLKPLGGRVLRSDLWRFTRRSVPRGVGLGLLVGIFLMIPACRSSVRLCCACRSAATSRSRRQ
jgi:hypothetical protein